MSAEVPSSIRTGRRARGRPPKFPLKPAHGGDHPAIFRFLTGIFQGPSQAEFKASLEDPFYEPRDRLLIKQGPQIVGHVHVTHRLMHFGPLQIPAAGLAQLAVLPECRGQGHADRLLAAAEAHMKKTGAMIGLIRTSSPHVFRRTGWDVCVRHSDSRADARDILSGLIDRGLRRRQLHIRPHRRWELPALMRIYDQNLSDAYGPIERTEAYWQWLTRRQAYDQIYMALDGPELMELEEISTRIVGYAVTRGERIVELMTAPNQRRAAAELLARCCRDAIEHDRHGLILHAPEKYFLHKILRDVGEVHHVHESDQGEVMMVRLLDPVKLLELFGTEFSRRARAADLPPSFELGLAVDKRKYCIEFAPGKITIQTQRLGRSYLQLNVADFTRLLLGQLDWPAALADGRLSCSTALAERIGRALFPQLPMWRPPLDDLPA